MCIKVRNRKKFSKNPLF